MRPADHGPSLSKSRRSTRTSHSRRPPSPQSRCAGTAVSPSAASGDAAERRRLDAADGNTRCGIRWGCHRPLFNIGQTDMKATGRQPGVRWRDPGSRLPRSQQPGGRVTAHLCRPLLPQRAHTQPQPKHRIIVRFQGRRRSGVSAIPERGLGGGRLRRAKGHALRAWATLDTIYSAFFRLSRGSHVFRICGAVPQAAFPKRLHR